MKVGEGLNLKLNDEVFVLVVDTWSATVHEGYIKALTWSRDSEVHSDTFGESVVFADIQSPYSIDPGDCFTHEHCHNIFQSEDTAYDEGIRRMKQIISRYNTSIKEIEESV